MTVVSTGTSRTSYTFAGDVASALATVQRVDGELAAHPGPAQLAAATTELDSAMSSVFAAVCDQDGTPAAAVSAVHAAIAHLTAAKASLALPAAKVASGAAGCASQAQQDTTAAVAALQQAATAAH